MEASVMWSNPGMSNLSCLLGDAIFIHVSRRYTYVARLVAVLLCIVGLYCLCYSIPFLCDLLYLLLFATRACHQPSARPSGP